MGEFALESSAFENAQAIPSRYSCEGEDVSPPLRWANVPEGTRSLALVVDNANAQAARLYRSSLALWPADDAGRPQLLFRYCSALQATGEPEQERVLEDAREALLAAGDVDTAAEAEVLADMWWYRGQGDRADRHRERAAALVQDRAPSPSKARVLAAVSRLRMMMDENEEAIRVGGEALAIANALGIGELRADLLVTLGTAALQRGDASGEADVERGLEIALEANALRVAARAYNNLGAVMGNTANHSRRLELDAEALRLAQRLGNREQVRFVQARMCDHLFVRGEWDEALTIADEFITVCESGSPHLQESTIRKIRASIRLARGEEEKALADWERGIASARRSQILGDVIHQLAWGASLHAELGRLAEAQALADELLAHDAAAVAHYGISLAWVAGRIGRRAELRAKLEAAPQDLDDPHWFLPVARDLVLAGDLAKAADVGSEKSFAFAYGARARLDAARQLSEQGRHKEASEQAAKALAFYRSVGATRYIREAEALLAVAT
jgi:tetratricopeptide (TPR) repeat protein